MMQYMAKLKKTPVENDARQTKLDFVIKKIEKREESSQEKQEPKKGKKDKKVVVKQASSSGQCQQMQEMFEKVSLSKDGSHSQQDNQPNQYQNSEIDQIWQQTCQIADRLRLPEFTQIRLQDLNMCYNNIVESSPHLRYLMFSDLVNVLQEYHDKFQVNSKTFAASMRPKQYKSLKRFYQDWSLHLGGLCQGQSKFSAQLEKKGLGQKKPARQLKKIKKIKKQANKQRQLQYQPVQKMNLPDPKGKFITKGEQKIIVLQNKEQIIKPEISEIPANNLQAQVNKKDQPIKNQIVQAPNKKQQLPPTETPKKDQNQILLQQMQEKLRLQIINAQQKQKQYENRLRSQLKSLEQFKKQLTESIKKPIKVVQVSNTKSIQKPKDSKQSKKSKSLLKPTNDQSQQQQIEQTPRKKQKRMSMFGMNTSNSKKKSSQSPKKAKKSHGYYNYVPCQDCADEETLVFKNKGQKPQKQVDKIAQRPFCQSCYLRIQKVLQHLKGLISYAVAYVVTGDQQNCPDIVQNIQKLKAFNMELNIKQDPQNDFIAFLQNLTLMRDNHFKKKDLDNILQLGQIAQILLQQWNLLSLQRVAFNWAIHHTKLGNENARAQGYFNLNPIKLFYLGVSGNKCQPADQRNCAQLSTEWNKDLNTFWYPQRFNDFEPISTVWKLFSRYLHQVVHSCITFDVKEEDVGRWVFKAKKYTSITASKDYSDFAERLSKKVKK